MYKDRFFLSESAFKDVFLTFDEGMEQVRRVTEKVKTGSPRLLLLAGAGISMNPDTELVGWDDFVREFFNAFSGVARGLDSTLQALSAHVLVVDEYMQTSGEKFQFGIYDRYTLAMILRQAISNYLDESRNEDERRLVQEFFTKFMKNLLKAREPNKNHKAIARTDYRSIITTNYDDYIELASQRLQNADHELTELGISAADKGQFAASIRTRARNVWHIHGSFDDIVDRFDYDKGADDNVDVMFTYQDAMFYNKRHEDVDLLLKTLLLRHPALIVGYGGRDHHIETLFNQMATDFRDFYGGAFAADNSDDAPERFMVMHEDEVNLPNKGEIRNHVFAAMRKNQFVKVIVVDDFNKVTTLLEAVADSMPV